MQSQKSIQQEMLALKGEEVARKEAEQKAIDDELEALKAAVQAKRERIQDTPAEPVPAAAAEAPTSVMEKAPKSVVDDSPPPVAAEPPPTVAPVVTRLVRGVVPGSLRHLEPVVAHHRGTRADRPRPAPDSLAHAASGASIPSDPNRLLAGVPAAINRARYVTGEEGHVA